MKKRNSNSVRLLYNVFLILTLFFVTLFMVMNPSLQARERLVGTSIAVARETSETRRFPAVLSAVQTATLSFLVGGPLVEVRTKAGISVKKRGNIDAY